MSDDARKRGLEQMARYQGSENVDAGREYLRELDHDLERHVLDFVYGEIYSGAALDPRTRVLCTIAMLGVLGEQVQLGVYVRAARRLEVSEEEIREVLRQVAVYAGFPAAWNGLATMKGALADSEVGG